MIARCEHLESMAVRTHAYPDLIAARHNSFEYLQTTHLFLIFYTFCLKLDVWPTDHPAGRHARMQLQQLPAAAQRKIIRVKSKLVSLASFILSVTDDQRLRKITSCATLRDVIIIAEPVDEPKPSLRPRLRFNL